MSSWSPCSPVTSVSPSISPTHLTSVMALGSALPILPSLPSWPLPLLGPCLLYPWPPPLPPGLQSCSFQPIPHCPNRLFSACADPVPFLLQAFLWLPLPSSCRPHCTPGSAVSAPGDHSRPLRPLSTFHLTFWPRLAVSVHWLSPTTLHISSA